MSALSTEVKTDLRKFITDYLVITTPYQVTNEECTECQRTHRESCDAGCHVMEITFATDDNGSAWQYQTGDNSYTGGCYGLPHWYVTSIAPGANRNEFVTEVINGLEEVLHDY